MRELNINGKIIQIEEWIYNMMLEFNERLNNV